MDWKDELTRALAPWEINLLPDHLESFEIYLEELRRWTPRASLTSLTDARDIALGHFADSLAALLASRAFDLKEGRVIDIGTGAGFPGLPLKIVRPGWALTLIEATRKKSDFLRSVVAALEMPSVEVLRVRCEETAHEKAFRERFDLAFSRALAGFPVVLELCLPFVKVGGCLIAHRGRNGGEEARESARALEELGGVVQEIRSYQIKGFEGTRTLVCVKKVEKMSDRFPRRVGIPAKRPL